MELQQIKYFLAVVREGNFSRAATACHVTQPSLTRGIRKLETSIGGPLFDRRTSGPELTDLGRTLMPRLQRVSEELAVALDEAHGLHFRVQKRLRVGVVNGLGPMRFALVLSRLKSTAPDHEVAIEEMGSRDIVDRLAEGELDVGLAALRAYPDEIAVKPLFSERFHVAFPREHRFGKEERVELDELAGETLLAHSISGLEEAYAACFEDRAFPLKPRHTYDREDWVQQLVLEGAGVAIVAEHVPLREGLASRPLAAPELVREIALVTVRGRPRSSVADAFVRLVGAHRW